MARGTVIGEVDGIYDNGAISTASRECSTRRTNSNFSPGNGGAIRFPTPSHSDVPSVQPVLDSHARHCFEIGSIGRQKKCVVDQRRRRDFQIP